MASYLPNIIIDDAPSEKLQKHNNNNDMKEAGCRRIAAIEVGRPPRPQDLMSLVVAVAEGRASPAAGGS